MKKEIIKSFLLDHLFFTVVYFVSNFLIGLFYFLSSDVRLEIVYPLCISLFFYLIFMLYKLIKYYSFNIKVNKLRCNMNFCIQGTSMEEKKFVKLICNLHNDYLHKISKIEVKSKDEKKFLSQWIHNMKTPVAVIDLICQKVENNEIDKDKALSDIKDENIKLLSNLEQVLNLIRLDDFANDYELTPVDLVQSIRNVINKRKKQFIYSSIYPRFNTDDSIMVLSDKKWNEAMLDQIVSNAIKYSALQNSKNIYFDIKIEEDKVLLSIKDEGIGIPEYDIDRVFQPFFTGENGRKYPNATGIGLYFCSRVAKRLLHTIRIESKEGCGTRVTVEYMLKRVEKREELKSSSEEVRSNLKK